MQPGIWIIAKARAVADDILGRNLSTPIELCRVVTEPQKLSDDMHVHVEFLYADR